MLTKVLAIVQSAAWLHAADFAFGAVEMILVLALLGLVPQVIGDGRTDRSREGELFFRRVGIREEACVNRLFARVITLNHSNLVPVPGGPASRNTYYEQALAKLLRLRRALKRERG